MIAKLTEMAEKHGWRLIKWQEDIKMVSFKKGDDRVNIYTTTMTVATCVRHPKLGKTQLFRRGVTRLELDKIFENPRVHTKKGYYYR
jgi:hypothetical protein